ncbi:CYTH domain-containing protein [Mucilaginibacter sp.]|uniref:CYTH domain-containing protein n=1 Tax=Mucilaginibacter sp. TaxID=1882438 RepID=UPI002841A228|nr:CYTH domain-containing protein [Mucilaginibacter sp.]MDR3695878.1 CYTH domain-containing protein [Mucilaginibacter sp.]
MGLEIERKFLVDHEKWEEINKPDGIHYRQGYLVDEPGKTIRVRVAGKKGFITIKGSTRGITRKEFEYEIPVDEAVQLIDGFAGSEVEKIRYGITFEGNLWEVDEFLGDNKDLIMAEIELKQEDEAFEKPGWITREVSDDKRYYNSYLAKNPYRQWRK